MNATIHNLDLNRLNLFKEVVLARSFTQAAQRLHLPKSKVSRNVSALERELGVQLIYRTTRKLQLTPAGQELFDRAVPLLSELTSTLEQVSMGSEEVAGPLKISVPEDLGVEAMADICRSFMSIYPRVRINLHVGNQLVDLVGESYDLAVRVGRLKDSTLRARKVAAIGLRPYMSPALKSRVHDLHRVEDLEHVPFLSFTAISAAKKTLRFINGKESRTINVHSIFQANNFFVLRALMIQSVGFGLLPEFLAREAVAKGQLVPAAKDWMYVGDPMQIVTPHQSEMPMRTRRFIEHLMQQLQALL